MNQQKIGKFIYENRKKKELTQNELSKKLKVSNHTISNWENGKSMPSYDLLIPLTKELDITISELINGEYDTNKEEPNKVVEKTINFLKQIDKDKKKKYRRIGIILITLGFIIKILSMMFIHHFWDYDNYYIILSYIITIIGISYLFHEEKVKNILSKTIVGSIITLLLFTSIDIAEIKIFDVPPRYFNTRDGYTNYIGEYYALVYYTTPLYDVYGCVYEYKINPDAYPKTNYKIVPKTKNHNMKELAEKYCKKK